MSTRRLYAKFLICLFVLFCCIFNSFAKTDKKVLVTAQAAIVVDLDKNKTLYSKNIHKRYAPASTVKILTALIALEELGADSQVTISKNASNAEPSKVWLVEDAAYNSLDLIDAVLISSANDASVALAEAAATTEEDFAKKMNRRAKLLGARNSSFTNASGLPSKNQYSTAYDLYRITKTALKNPTIYNAMKKKKEKIRGTSGKEITLVNHNKLVFKKRKPTVLLKTGYTKTALHCYAGIAYFDNREYAIVILKSRKPWQDIEKLLEFIKKILKT